MKLEVKGKGPVTLTKANFVGQGGEGQVYAKSGIAYNGNLFVKNDDSINYIDFTELPKNLMVSQNQ